MALHEMKKLKQDLQKEIGQLPLVVINDFHNWGKTVGPVKVFSIAPTTVEELQKVIRAAGKYGLKVRVHGKKHSWSELFSDAGQICIDGTHLTLNRHDGKNIVLNEPDPDGQRTITVSSGVAMTEIVDFFLKNNVCFESNAILEGVTIGGIVAPGCHGVGRNQLSISDQVTSMTLVDSSGEIRTFKDGETDADTMKALQVNLGLFGIMTELTMKVHPMYEVEVSNRFPTVYDIFFNPEKLRELVKDNWSYEVYWFPFNSMLHTEGQGGLKHALRTGDVSDFVWNPMVDELWVRAINPMRPGQLHLPPVGRKFREAVERLDDSSAKAGGVAQKVQQFFEKVIGHKAMDWVVNHAEAATSCATFKGLKDEYSMQVGICQSITDAIHYRFGLDYVRTYDMEFAFDCPDDEFHNICTAITYVVERVQHYAKEGKYPLTTGMEMRWISHSDTLLCPAVVGNPKRGGSGRTLYLEIYSYEGTDHARQFFTEVAKKWMSLPGAKPLPHWGKMWPEGSVPSRKEYIQEGYGKDTIDKFKKVRADLKVDPNNMFTNKYLCDIFDLK